MKNIRLCTLAAAIAILAAPMLAQAQALPAELTETEALQRYLKRFFPLPTTAVEIDAASNSLNIQVAPSYPWRLGELMAQEAHLVLSHRSAVGDPSIKCSRKTGRAGQKWRYEKIHRDTD